MNTDPAWEAALDWLLRLQAEPHDEALQQACQAWQAESPEHARAWRKAQRVWLLSGAVPAQHAQDWQAPATRRAPASPRPRAHAWRRLSLAGAALAACLVLALSLQAPGLTPDPASARNELTLADGSRVTLGASSRIEARMSAEERLVQLTPGEAFFDVARDPQRPFSVQIGNTWVKVLGTAFDITASDNNLSISVAHGLVSVRDEKLRSDLFDTPLQAGERLRLNRETGEVLRDEVPLRQIAAWRSGLLVAEEETIDNLVARLRQHHQGLILVQDAALGRQRVTGAYQLDKPLAALRAIVEPHGGRVESYSPWVVVVRR